MVRIKRRNIVWLTLLGILLGLGVAGAETLALQATLIGIFLVAAVLSLAEPRFRPRLQTARAQKNRYANRMSATAKEASERAQRHTTYTPEGLTLLDVGLIATHTSSEGMVMRRGRNISLDEDGVRPYITLHVEPEQAERHSTLRFEMSDPDGHMRYVHEVKVYLRDGDMNIVADHHLPLANQSEPLKAGDWNLNVEMDGVTVGMLVFTTTASLQERQRQIQAAAQRLQKTAPDEPVSLEELLRPKDRRR